ncbi:hypothetical protein SBA5_1620005 [Candidatus Sulfotelmatomonas gaucii]|uniref:Uncharacterized protein n=1 Tax=Candidatus Sulfuritelmatomonas gaucii TaxID=2043161 RepID=A0A2N9L5V1_9BACT|nr:hypothetical protein SBA5_1620005 [Candidatus Sulfotelmatomonas gaucii]
MGQARFHPAQTITLVTSRHANRRLTFPIAEEWQRAPRANQGARARYLDPRWVPGELEIVTAKAATSTILAR